MSLFQFSSPTKFWSHAKRNSNRATVDPLPNKWADGQLKAALKELPYQQTTTSESVIAVAENDTCEPHTQPTSPQALDFVIEAMVRHPMTGENIGRVSLTAESQNSSLRHFELRRGNLKASWAKGEILLICPLNGPAKYVKILAYPPDDCHTGLLQIES